MTHRRWSRPGQLQPNLKLKSKKKIIATSSCHSTRIKVSSNTHNHTAINNEKWEDLTALLGLITVLLEYIDLELQGLAKKWGRPWPPRLPRGWAIKNMIAAMAPHAMHFLVEHHLTPTYTCNYTCTHCNCMCE